MEKKHFELEKQYTISLTNGHKLIEFNCEIELGQVFTENKIDKTSELTEILQDNFDDFNEQLKVLVEVLEAEVAALGKSNLTVIKTLKKLKDKKFYILNK